MENEIKDLTNMLVDTIKNKMTTENPWVSYNDISELTIGKVCNEMELQFTLYHLLTDGIVNAIYSETSENTGDLTDLVYCVESHRQDMAKKYFNDIFEEGISGLNELMHIYVENEDYEKAAIYRDRIAELRNKNLK